MKKMWLSFDRGRQQLDEKKGKPFYKDFFAAKPAEIKEKMATKNLTKVYISNQKKQNKNNKGNKNKCLWIIPIQFFNKKKSSVKFLKKSGVVGTYFLCKNTYVHFWNVMSNFGVSQNIVSILQKTNFCFRALLCLNRLIFESRLLSCGHLYKLSHTFSWTDFFYNSPETPIF